jgi:hypothetical protein
MTKEEMEMVGKQISAGVASAIVDAFRTEGLLPKADAAVEDAPQAEADAEPATDEPQAKAEEAGDEPAEEAAAEGEAETSEAEGDDAPAEDTSGEEQAKLVSEAMEAGLGEVTKTLGTIAEGMTALSGRIAAMEAAPGASNALAGQDDAKPAKKAIFSGLFSPDA